MEDWAEIRRLRKAEGMPIKVIARQMGCSKSTVKSALADDGPPKYERTGRGSIADAFDARIRELLLAHPRMPSTVIADRVDWPYSPQTISARVSELRPLYLPPDPSSRTAYEAGEIAQNDFWFPDIKLPVGFGQFRTPKRLPVLTSVMGYSRWSSAFLLPSRNAQDLFAGWWQQLQRFGAVPRVMVWDGEAAIGRWRGPRSELTVDCQGFRGTLATKVIVCKPADLRRRVWLSGSTTIWSSSAHPVNAHP